MIFQLPRYFLPAVSISSFHPRKEYSTDNMSAETGSSAARKYVTLVSKEGFEFVVLRQAATGSSPAIRSMLDPDRNYLEAQTGRCQFQEIRYVSRRVPRYSAAYPGVWTSRVL